jgi:ADP-ribose pyrophosphatase YjhB (NUDIX family)
MTQQAIRVRVGAAIIQDGAVLLVEYDGSDADCGLHYNFPGGGVEPGETLEEALRRELREETCAEIEIGPLLGIYEYIPARCAAKYGPTPELMLLFRCSLQAGSQPQMPRVPDATQIGVRWISLASLLHAPLLPVPSARLVAALCSEAGETVFCEENR